MEIGETGSSGQHVLDHAGKEDRSELEYAMHRRHPREEGFVRKMDLQILNLEIVTSKNVQVRRNDIIQ